MNSRGGPKQTSLPQRQPLTSFAGLTNDNKRMFVKHFEHFPLLYPCILFYFSKAGQGNAAAAQSKQTCAVFLFRQHPEANKIGLDVEKNLCVARDNDKAVSSMEFHRTEVEKVPVADGASQ